MRREKPRSSLVRGRAASDEKSAGVMSSWRHIRCAPAHRAPPFVDASWSGDDPLMGAAAAEIAAISCTMASRDGCGCFCRKAQAFISIPDVQ